MKAAHPRAWLPYRTRPRRALALSPLSDEAGDPWEFGPPLTPHYNEYVGWIAIGLLVAAVLVVVAAEWPRLSERIGADAWTARSRRRRKEKLTLIRGDESEDDFV